MARTAAAFCDEILNTFTVRIADTQALLREAFRLRHQVYCVENAFEPRHPDGLETDRFDDRAPHALLFHRASDEPIGTVRLVLPECDATHGTLPVHAVCGPEVFARASLPVASTAEISRFALSRTRLRQIHQTFAPDETRHVLSYACVGLIAALRQMARANGITHVVAVMEPSLRRRLIMIGLPMAEMCDPVNFHGVRVPCCTSLDLLETRLRKLRPDLWPAMTADVVAPMSAALAARTPALAAA
jgi:N-acyl amino acid synthase of PEP-CTERM/exosortase system